MAVSFDLFGTLVTADRPADPAAAVASELAARDVAVPDAWATAYAEPHVETPDSAEVPLPEHVRAALSSRGVSAGPAVVREAVLAAFDPEVETLEGGAAALCAARERGPVAICSNCSVPGLVERSLDRAGFEPAAFDAVVASVDCGWRKPAPEIFRETAAQLGTEPGDLVHVGDDPRTDGGIEAVGGTAVLLEETPLESVPDRLEAIA